MTYPIAPERTALLIIDMQNDFLLPSSPLAAVEPEAVIAGVNLVIAASRQAAIPIFFTASTHTDDYLRGRMGDLFPGAPSRRQGAPGWQIHPAVDCRPGDALVCKPRYSAFWRTNLDEQLQALGVDTLVLGGVCTNVCVAATARDAMFREYRVIVISDACRTYDLPDTGWGAVLAAEVQRVTLADLGTHVGEVATVAAVVERVRRAAE